jgi:triacylglycerol lipase
MNLVFASGFLFPQRLIGIDYFRDLKDHVERQHQHKTLFPHVAPVGTSEDRARALADKIHEAFPEGEIHIIAHSMGGLDSRVLIARNRHGLSDPGRIVSLTTLSTPHRGSPVADLLAGPRPNDPRRDLYDMLSRQVRELGLDTGALKDLTAEGAAKIPDPRQTHPHIRYCSYFAAGREGIRPTSFALLATHIFIEKATGQPNDGMVAWDSARYGEFQEPFWHGDHADIIGHNLDGPVLGGPQFDHFAAFDRVIGQLQ